MSETTIPVKRATADVNWPDRRLEINAKALERYLVEFLRDECQRQRRIEKFVLGLSGGVDSAVVAYLAAKAFGAENVTAIRMPYKVSSQASLDHARLVVEDLGLPEMTIDITAMVDGYASAAPEPVTPYRIGNVCARCRMTVLFDQAAAVKGLPLGTGNKTERLFGYFTWHGDDAPPINPLGDLFKTQVWQLARHLGVPSVIVDKPPTADLIQGQTDEGDFGISYEKADQILVCVLAGKSDAEIAKYGFSVQECQLVRQKVASTHWKRKTPTVAMVSESAIGEYYLRPVDY